MKQDNQTALITGASRGLGREIARLLAQKGMGLVLTARGPEALQETADELSTLTKVVAIPGDISDPTHAERLVRAARDQFGGVDILINNASTIGSSPMPRLEEYRLSALATVFRVNVIAPLHLIRLVLPAMRERAKGVIINVTSDAGVQAYPGWGGYGASKAALEQMSRVLAAELDGTGIRVYVVDPGDMNTEMHRDAEPGVDLSNLPGPEVPAPAFLYLVEQETAPFGRFEAQKLVAEGLESSAAE